MVMVVQLAYLEGIVLLAADLDPRPVKRVKKWRGEPFEQMQGVPIKD
jgi:hypothetical protein